MPLANFAVCLSAALVLATACNRAEPAHSTQSPGAVASPQTAGTPTARDSIAAMADSGRIRGNPDAPIWFVIVSDFQCPFCKQWHDETFPAIEREYVSTGKVRIAYLNFPLSMHRFAKDAAEAAMCASVQGKFWEMQDALFATQEQWAASQNAAPIFDSSAAGLGLNMNAWRSCMSSDATMPLIQADHDRAAASGVRSTPSFFVGDEGIAGAEPFSTFQVAIERQLAKKAGATTPPAR